MAESFSSAGYKKNVMHQTGGIDDYGAFTGGRGARETRAVDDFSDMKMGTLSPPVPPPEVYLGTKSGGTVGRFLGIIGKNGLARKNRYKVHVEGIGPNKAIGKVAGFDLAALNLMCESIAFPAQNLRSTPDTLRFGPEREQVQGVTYGEITASFICSTDMREKRFFEEWHKLVFNQDSWEVSYYDQFIGSMRIVQDDRMDIKTYGVQLAEVYPKTITQMDVGYAQNDIYQSLSIEFQYHRWTQIEPGSWT